MALHRRLPPPPRSGGFLNWTPAVHNGVFRARYQRNGEPPPYTNTLALPHPHSPKLPTPTPPYPHSLPPARLYNVQIISHRGQWLSPDERNTREAFSRSFQNGFGVETDLRDAGGQIVISHDPPSEDAMTLDDFFRLYKAEGDGLTLALNIKSDSLYGLLKEAVDEHGIDGYFAFDMSVPDLLGYLKLGLITMTRQSDIEPVACCFNECEGVWFDALRSPWPMRGEIEKALESGKLASIVSPELHGRTHLEFWQEMKAWQFISNPGLILCTDFPSEAKLFFESA